MYVVFLDLEAAWEIDHRWIRLFDKQKWMKTFIDVFYQVWCYCKSYFHWEWCFNSLIQALVYEWEWLLFWWLQDQDTGSQNINGNTSFLIKKTKTKINYNSWWMWINCDFKHDDLQPTAYGLYCHILLLPLTQSCAFYF